MIESIKRVSNIIMGSRWFLYLGFALIFLALTCLPAKMRVATQPETPETSLLWMGPVYALLIGLWSLPNMLLGALESSMSKRAVLLRLSLILFFANTFLVGILWGQIGYWRDMEIQMLLNYSPFLIPCLIVNVIGLLYAKMDEKLARSLRNVKARILLTIIFAAFPIIAAGWVLHSWWQSITL